MGDTADVTITFPDGSKNAIARGTTLQDLAKLLGAKFLKESIAGKINGRLVDLSTSLDRDATIELVLEHNPEARAVIRHSTAHIMASAVKELFPTAKVTMVRLSMMASMVSTMTSITSAASTSRISNVSHKEWTRS